MPSHLRYTIAIVLLAAMVPLAGRADGLDDMVGWYDVDNGTRYMVTWAASEGLTVTDFATRSQQVFQPVSDDVFATDSPSAKPAELRFTRAVGGPVTGFRWTDSSGSQHVALRTSRSSYEQHEVYFGGATRLAGLLLVPATEGPHPAVVLVHGPGPVDRDDLWYLYQADYLARHGIAVLLPDKRGCGKSAGSWESASFDDLADDVVEGVAYLEGFDGIDEVGIVGLSQGGWIAPLAARRRASISFVVNVSGSAVTPSEQNRHEIASNLRSYGTPDFLVPLIAFALDRREKHRREAWWEQNGGFDAVEHWEALHVPVLVLYGSNDERDVVPVHRSVARLEEARSRSGNTDFSIRVLPNTGHEMDDPDTGWIRSEYLEALSSWIRSRTL